MMCVFEGEFLVAYTVDKRSNSGLCPSLYFLPHCPTITTTTTTKSQKKVTSSPSSSSLLLLLLLFRCSFCSFLLSLSLRFLGLSSSWRFRSASSASFFRFSQRLTRCSSIHVASSSARRFSSSILSEFLSAYVMQVFHIELAGNVQLNTTYRSSQLRRQEFCPSTIQSTIVQTQHRQRRYFEDKFLLIPEDLRLTILRVLLLSFHRSFKYLEYPWRADCHPNCVVL